MHLICTKLRYTIIKKKTIKMAENGLILWKYLQWNLYYASLSFLFLLLYYAYLSFCSFHFLLLYYASFSFLFLLLYYTSISICSFHFLLICYASLSFLFLPLYYASLSFLFLPLYYASLSFLFLPLYYASLSFLFLLLYYASLSFLFLPLYYASLSFHFLLLYYASLSFCSFHFLSLFPRLSTSSPPPWEGRPKCGPHVPATGPTLSSGGGDSIRGPGLVISALQYNAIDIHIYLSYMYFSYLFILCIYFLFILCIHIFIYDARTAISQDVQTSYSVQLAFAKFLSKIKGNF